MGDPFWRRFSASRDNNNRSAGPPPPHYSRERTLATEYTSLNTRTSASAAAAERLVATTAPRQSRNDLFETDWGWKGDTEQRSAAVAGEGNVLRGLGIMVPTFTADQNKLLEDERRALCNDVPTSVEPLSPRQHPSDHLSLFTSEPVLGAPIQLQSTPPIHQQHQPSDHHLNLQPPTRSRNDAIYNVNYLTVTPPRFNTPPPLPVSTAASGGKKPPQQLDLGPGLSLPASATSYHRSSSLVAESDVVRLSPLSNTTGDSPATSDTSITFICKQPYQVSNTLDEDTRPTRSATFASASSSSGSSTSNCSGITSFADHTVQQHSETRPTHGRVSTGSANTEQSRFGTTLSPAVSPITPVTPDTHFSPACTSSFSSFTPTTDDKKAIQQQVGIHSSPSARIMMTPTSPSSEVSLSRTSSMTIVQSPSTALANITRKADRLLVPDDNADNDDDDDGDVVGRDAEAARESGAGVARVRVDIVSRQWLVGYGRYAKVYLGAFKPALPSPTTISSSTTPSTRQGSEVSPSPPIQTSTGWSLCAAKVFDNDIESISMANRESAMLGYLQEDLPSTRLRPETLVRSGMRESEEGDRGEEGGGRRYILSRIALVDENIIEPPPSFATATPGDLSRINSQRASRTSTDTHMVCRSPTDNLPGTTTTTTTMVTPNKATDAISSGPHIRTVHGVHRRGHGKGLGYSHAASETTAILRQLGKTAIAAKSSTDAFLSEGGTDLAPSHRPVLLLPFYANGSMATFLKTREEPVDEELWMNWFEQGLRALSWCKKKGVLHNDIKPANFLLDDDRNLRLGDFGSALRINPDDPPHDGIGLGTVSYSSPEIVDPSTERTFSFPSDLFSFGVTMRQCMTGREPYEGLRTVELMYHVRKGNYWEWHARRDIDLPSSPSSTSSSRFPISPTTHHIARLRSTTTTATSPIPRSHSVIGTSDGIRRAESLREPSRTRADVHRPALARTPSSDVVVRQSTAVATTSEGGAANVAGTGAGWSTVQDEREGWLRRILDPDPANRPSVEDLLEQLARIHAIHRGCFG